MSETHQVERELQLLNAQMAVEYYKNLIAYQKENNEQPWFLGLFMAMQWVRFVTESHPDTAELGAFVEALESELDRQGIQWRYMWRRAQDWAQSLAQQQA
jgi:hypothetical protein